MMEGEEGRETVQGIEKNTFRLSTFPDWNIVYGDRGSK